MGEGRRRLGMGGGGARAGAGRTAPANRSLGDSWFTNCEGTSGAEGCIVVHDETCRLRSDVVALVSAAGATHDGIGKEKSPGDGEPPGPIDLGRNDDLTCADP